MIILFPSNMTSPSTWTYTLKYSIHTDYCKQTATDLNKECCNFISRVNGCSSFFSCQFPEKVPQKAVFLCEKSCQNSSRNSCAFFIYFWCRIINNAQSTMKTRFLQKHIYRGRRAIFYMPLYSWPVSLPLRPAPCHTACLTVKFSVDYWTWPLTDTA